ncbi:MAG: hypothetical protein J0I20_00585 [Chloroflexi bacterium]|nr:hypothetical protein [Chloroflexota bacterium]OJW00007.1 MAG: hypothetical protein BGO39_27380 [Chloroflexi bacterium 54-19]
MKQEVRFFHCNEHEEVVEIESYFEENGAIISLKQSAPGHEQPFVPLKAHLEQEGWQFELAGTTRLGHSPVQLNSYVARRSVTG